MQPVLIEGQWRPSSSPAASFNAMNPATGQPLDDTYPVSGYPEIERALVAAQGAVEALRGALAEGDDEVRLAAAWGLASLVDAKSTEVYRDPTTSGGKNLMREVPEVLVLRRDRE